MTATAAAFSPRRNLFDSEAVMKLLGALIVSLLFLINASPAHDSWINRERFRNPVTLDWCCGREDCGIVMPAPKATAVGWAIHGEEILDLDGRRLRVDEVVPYDETLPSPDGYFYRATLSLATTKPVKTFGTISGMASADASLLHLNRCKGICSRLPTALGYMPAGSLSASFLATAAGRFRHSTYPPLVHPS